ncbi:MAG: TlpA family protein disulfide reductase [Gallionella sp.]|nr:MAG: TlpA family protein disulfide reductase [Gallionella sp.]
MGIPGNLLRGLLLLLLSLPLPVHAAGFLLEDIQGKTHRLADYRGKWVLVNFWATWCPPCLNEIPELVSLHNAHKDHDLVVVSVAMDSGPRKKVADFAQAHGISYPVVNWQWQKSQKLDQEITRNFGDIEAVPSSFLYTPKGELVSHQLGGEVTRESVETYIKNKKLD